jgi:hypothetical protein
MEKPLLLSTLLSANQLSWICCVNPDSPIGPICTNPVQILGTTSSSCTSTFGNGNKQAGARCDKSRSTQFTIENTSITTIKIQIHDGTNPGTFDCGENNCCAGSGSGCSLISGVTQYKRAKQPAVFHQRFEYLFNIGDCW